MCTLAVWISDCGSLSYHTGNPLHSMYINFRKWYVMWCVSVNHTLHIHLSQGLTSYHLLSIWEEKYLKITTERWWKIVYWFCIRNNRFHDIDHIQEYNFKMYELQIYFYYSIPDRCYASFKTLAVFYTIICNIYF